MDGTVVEPLHGDRITIKTGYRDRPFEVRELMQERLSNLRKGEWVTLLVDNENKVVDIAVPKHRLIDDMGPSSSMRESE